MPRLNGKHQRLLISGCPSCLSLKRRISQNIRRERDSTLRLLATPPGGHWYRRKWLKEHGIPGNAGTLGYLKKRIAKELGLAAFLKPRKEAK